MKNRLLMGVVFFGCLFAISHANAQYVRAANGYPVPTQIYTDVVGSPYLVDAWSKGLVEMVDGRTYKDVLIKYNMVDDVLYFKYENTDPLVFVDPVKEFKIDYVINNIPYEKHFKNGYKGISGGTEKNFFEVLSEGTAQLIKRDFKSIDETKEYGSSNVTRTFSDNVKYYLVVAGKATQIKKDKKSILTVLGNKQPELESYIKANGLNFKSDEDMAKLVSYYNSI